MKEAQGTQLQQVQQRFHQFVEIIDTIEPEKVDLKEIDYLIGMLDDMENKLNEIKNK